MKCVLQDKDCVECGKCNLCDLDPQKVCDNCCKCIDEDEVDYNGIVIDEIIEEEEGDIS